MSTTRDIPETSTVPRHIAIIMDGNGRWAKQRLLPRVAGHRKGVEAVRATVRSCIERGVDFLTLFAFSSENWRRPADEVSILMQLFLRALEQEVEKLNNNGIRFKVIGETSRFEPRIRELISSAEALTAGNAGLTLTVAGGTLRRQRKSWSPRTLAQPRASIPRRSSRSCLWHMHPSPTFSFVRVASSESPTFYSGISRTRSFISPICCGPTSMRKHWTPRSRRIRSASDDLAARASNSRPAAEVCIVFDEDAHHYRGGACSGGAHCAFRAFGTGLGRSHARDRHHRR